MQPRRDPAVRGDAERWILHVDMDAFFAAIEQRDDPALAGKPVIVGGTGGRGVVAAASYEVRRFGVRSAMPVRAALRLCPQAICVRPRIQRYKEVSRQIFAIFDEHTPLVQGLSLDEAFLDVTRCPAPPHAAAARGSPLDQAVAIAREIKRRIRETTRLTASVGVAPNKLVAKIASDLDKPDGLTVVAPERVLEVLGPLSVRRLPGLGRKLGEKVEALGIHTLAQLREAPDALLWPLFGRDTQRVRDRAAGRDERAVVADWDEKSLSAEETFDRDIGDARVLQRQLVQLADRAAGRLRARELTAGCVAVKIRLSDFTTFTRQRNVSPAIQDSRSVAAIAAELLSRWLADHPGAKLRLLGVCLSQLGDARQLGLFGPAAPRDIRLDAAVDAVRGRFGMRALRRASSIK